MADIKVCDFPHVQQTPATHKIEIQYDEGAPGGHAQTLDACDVHNTAFQARITALLGP